MFTDEVWFLSGFKIRGSVIFKVANDQSSSIADVPAMFQRIHSNNRRSVTVSLRKFLISY